jgi:hypothetical protein
MGCAAVNWDKVDFITFSMISNWNLLEWVKFNNSRLDPFHLHKLRALSPIRNKHSTTSKKMLEQRERKTPSPVDFSLVSAKTTGQPVASHCDAFRNGWGILFDSRCRCSVIFTEDEFAAATRGACMNPDCDRSVISCQNCYKRYEETHTPMLCSICMCYNCDNESECHHQAQMRCATCPELGCVSCFCIMECTKTPGAKHWSYQCEDCSNDDVPAICKRCSVD